MNVFEKAHELGAMIAESAEFKKVNEAREAQTADNDAALVLMNYNRKRDQLIKEASDPDISNERMQEIRNEMEREVDKLNNNKTIADFMEAMKNLYVEKIKADADYEFASIESKEALLTRILNVCNTLYNQCKGGQQQVKVGKDIKVGDEEFYLFGFIDVLQPTTILDIKTCTKYKESKYRDSIQHSIYQFCTGVKDFKYVVADYSSTSYPQNCIIVDTSINDLEEAERRIKGRITNLVHYLKDNNLWDDYINLFCRGK